MAFDYECGSCGEQVPANKFHVKSGDCYKCFLAEGAPRFGFVGGGSYGREAFSTRTNKEVQDEQLRGAARAGRTIVPKSWRQELI